MLNTRNYNQSINEKDVAVKSNKLLFFKLMDYIERFIFLTFIHTGETNIWNIWVVVILIIVIDENMVS